jgi:hypothetical protein
MAIKWHKFVAGLKDDAGILAQKELKNLINNAKQDTEIFIKRQGQKLELYMNQLAEKKITKKQFEGYILDIRDLTRIQSRKMKVRAKAKAQRLVKGIKDLIIDGLIKLI